MLLARPARAGLAGPGPPVIGLSAAEGCHMPVLAPRPAADLFGPRQFRRFRRLRSIRCVVCRLPHSDVP
jgi:hypothetical protein